MSGNGIELKTLPLAIDKQPPTKKNKAVKSKGREVGPKSVFYQSSNKVRSEKDDINSKTTGLVSGVYRREAERDINMNSSKKTEKKSGIREWLMGKTAKGSKPKLSNLSRPDTMPVGPIVERLQKQSAFLSATMQQELRERGSRSPSSPSPEHEHLNYDEFFHKRHLFQNHSRPGFCDVCDDFILGIYKSAIRCKYCRHTCHYRCHLDIDIDCPKAPVKEKSLEDLTKETLEILSEKDGNKNVEEDIVSSLPENISSIDELRKLIDQFNASSSLIMTLQEDGVFNGFIRVLMSLNRPVNVDSDTSDLTMRKALHRSNSRRSSRRHQSVIATNRAASIKSQNSEPLERTSTLPSSNLAVPVANEDEYRRQRPRRRTSFYLPQDTKKPLHITSSTTAYEVIEALLNKYGVTDNPQKFSLYERTDEDDKIRLRKIDADEHPLVLSLLWGEFHSKKSFCLKENERGDFVWDAFQIPELKNFILILNREEEDMIKQIRKKYEDQMKLLQQALDYKKQNEFESHC